MSDKNLIAKIEGLKEKYAQLQEQLADPELMNDMKKFVKVNKEYKELTPVLETGGRYKKMVEDYDAAKDIIDNDKDEDLREMAKEELATLEVEIPKLGGNQAVAHSCGPSGCQECNS